MPALKVFLIIFCIFNTLCSWCDDPISGPDVPEGSYTYSAFDTTGVKVITGWMTIVFDDSVNVSGQWKFEKSEIQKLLDRKWAQVISAGFTMNHKYQST